MARNDIERAAARYRRSIDTRERVAIRFTLRAYRLAIASVESRIRMLEEGLEAHPEKEWRAYAIQQQERLHESLQNALDEAAITSGRSIDDQRVRAFVESRDVTRAAMIESLRAAGHATIATALGEIPARQSIEAMIAQVQAKSAVTDMLRKHSKSGARAAADRLVTAVMTGENPRKITGSIRASLQHEAWKALRIARTEVIRAHTAGAISQMREFPQLTPMYEWAAETGSACAACLAEHGSLHPTSEAPARHPNCFPAGVIAAGPRVTGSSSRWYSGDIVDVEFASGNRLSVTPNHPVLTTHGWVGAGSLDESSDVVRCKDAGRLARIVDPHDHQVPSMIEEVAVSVGSAHGVPPVTVPLSPMDIHGDGAGSDVAVIRSDRLLRDAIESALAQQIGQNDLVVGIGATPTLAGVGGGAEGIEATGGSAHCIMCGGDIAGSLLGGSGVHHELVGGGDVAKIDALGFKSNPDDVSRYAESLGDAVLGFAADIGGGDLAVGELDSAGGADLGSGERFPLGWRSPEPLGLKDLAEALLGDSPGAGSDLAAIAGEIELDRVVRVTQRSFAGHVYNLETVGGWYVADGIIAHNCKCVMLPVVIDPTTGQPLSEPMETGQDVIDRMSMHEAQQRFGKRRGELLTSPNRDRVPLAKMLTYRESDTWGKSVAIVPLKELA